MKIINNRGRCSSNPKNPFFPLWMLSWRVDKVVCHIKTFLSHEIYYKKKSPPIFTHCAYIFLLTGWFNNTCCLKRKQIFLLFFFVYCVKHAFCMLNNLLTGCENIGVFSNFFHCCQKEYIFFREWWWKQLLGFVEPNSGVKNATNPLSSCFCSKQNFVMCSHTCLHQQKITSTFAKKSRSTLTAN